MSVCEKCGQQVADDQFGTKLLQRFTVRQLQVLAHCAGGKTDAEIGLDMGCSTETVKRHMTNIREKTGMGNRVELANLFWSSRQLVLAAERVAGVAVARGHEPADLRMRMLGLPGYAA